MDALQLAEMREALNHKYAKLGEYREHGAATLLVLESEDIGLASPQSLYKAWLRAIEEESRPNLDQVWLVTTSLQEFPVYCFSGPIEVMEGVNPALTPRTFGSEHSL